MCVRSNGAERNGLAISSLGRGSRRALRLLLRHGPTAGAQATSNNARPGWLRHRRVAAARAALAILGELKRPTKSAHPVNWVGVLLNRPAQTRQAVKTAHL